MANLPGTEPNLLDKVIAFAAPTWAVERHKSRMVLAMSGGYTGARRDRRETRDFNPRATSADESVSGDLPTLRARSRDLVRNAPLAAGGINNIVKNTCATGLSAHPQPDLAVLGWTEEQGLAFSEQMYAHFDRWASSRDCDLTRTQNHYELQPLWVRCTLESGDCFALTPMVSLPNSPYKTRVQIVEADRVASPNGDGKTSEYGKKADGTPLITAVLNGGVEKDEFGAPLAYCILRKHPSSIGFWSRTVEWDRYLAFGPKTGRRNVLHGFDRLRPDQSRGVPILAPVIEPILQLRRYTDNEVMAAVVTSMFTVFIKTEAEANYQPPAAVQQGLVPEMALGNGTINQLGQNEDVTFANPNRPSTTFDPFVQAILKQIGMCLNLPYEVLTMSFTASYSAARGAMLEAWKFYLERRSFLVNSFCQPTYEALMDELVASGAISAPGYFRDPILRAAYQRCDWVGDAMASIDVEKDVRAAAAKVENGFSSIERETMKLESVSSRDVHRQRTREHQQRVNDGLEPPILGATATEMLTPPGEDAGQDDSEDETQQDKQKGGGK